MSQLEDLLISPDATILTVLERLGESQQQIVLVVNDERKLLGTVVDGDIRRAILKRVPLESPISEAMNPDPVTAPPEAGRESILQIMREKHILHLPLVDDENRVTGVEVIASLLQKPALTNWVVLMVGGKGDRLRPLTENTPKPLLAVGGTPLLETILQNFTAQGFQKFFFSVNYKAEMIADYFGDGEKWGVEINYITEEWPLGTAGALSLLPEQPTEPVLVMNGDILTSVDFTQLMSFHAEANVDATMCLREYDFEVPFGVVTVDGHRVMNISEKPVQSFFVNAGIYFLNPEVIAKVPTGEFYDMPDLISNLLQDGQNVAAYPLREYWIDIGRLQDFEKAQRDYADWSR